MSEQFCFEITEEEEGKRIDKFLSEQLEQLSRSFIQKLLKQNEILINGQPVKQNYRVSEGEQVLFMLPEQITPDILPESIPLDILYEDEDLLFINKPKGMVVHPSAGHYSGTLVNAIMYHCKDRLSAINGILRPGIVHRIDKDTTGVLVVCKNDSAHRDVAEQLAVHSITRKYRALCIGHPKEDQFTIEGNIGRSKYDRKKMDVVAVGGKPAITHIKVLDRLSRGISLVECELETGRTHQIRVHMSRHGFPLLGDPLYGPKKHPIALKSPGQMLHAMTLGLVHPRNKRYLEISAELPEEFSTILQKLS